VANSAELDFFEKMLIIFGKNYAIKRLAFIKFAAELTTKNYEKKYVFKNCRVSSE